MPNPANNITNIQYYAQNDGDIKFSLFDMQGKEIYNSKEHISSGTNSISFNTSALAQGMYMIRLQTESEFVSEKLIIAR